YPSGGEGVTVKVEGADPDEVVEAANRIEAANQRQHCATAKSRYTGLMSNFPPITDRNEDGSPVTFAFTPASEERAIEILLDHLILRELSARVVFDFTATEWDQAALDTDHPEWVGQIDERIASRILCRLMRSEIEGRAAAYDGLAQFDDA